MYKVRSCLDEGTERKFWLPLSSAIRILMLTPGGPALPSSTKACLWSWAAPSRHLCLVSLFPSKNVSPMSSWILASAESQ